MRTKRKAIDLVAYKDGQRIAFEIETGKSDAIANVKKCLDAGLNRVVVVATSAVVRDKLSGALQRDNRIELLTASEVFQRNYWGR